MKQALEQRFWDKVNKHGPVQPHMKTCCWIWIGGKFKDGYGAFHTVDKTTTALAHRIAWQLCKGLPPPGVDVLHRCDMRPCVRPSHLFLGDDLKNYQDSAKKGRNAFGERHGRSKLKERQVVQIRALRKSGRTLAQLGKKFGVTAQTINQLVRRIYWKHVP